MLDEYLQSSQNVTICPGPPSDYNSESGAGRGPQNYIAGTSWAGDLPPTRPEWGAQLGVFGCHGVLNSEPARFGKISSPSQVVMICETGYPVGRRGDACAYFIWYWMWAPNLYLPSFFYEPFHGNNKSMNFGFVDGHVALYNVEDIPYPDTVLYDNDWDEMGISFRRNYGHEWDYGL